MNSDDCAADSSDAWPEGNGTRCKIVPLRGSITTNSGVLPEVTSSAPSGLSAMTCGRSPGKDLRGVEPKGPPSPTLSPLEGERENSGLGPNQFLIQLQCCARSLGRCAPGQRHHAVGDGEFGQAGHRMNIQPPHDAFPVCL